MRGRPLLVQAGVAAVALAVAAVVWLRPPPQGAPGEFPVARLARGDVKAIHWDDGSHRVDVWRGPEPDVAARVPAGTLSVTLMLLEPASGSLTLMPVIAVAMSSVTAIEPGTVLTGASLTAVTLIVVVATLLDEVPSVTLTVTVRAVVNGVSPPPAAKVMPAMVDW